jgi:DNA-binding transcriptional MerR regulator
VTGELLTIGAFSRASGLSVKALRSYDRLGLLSPASVDLDTHYRLYSRDQIDRGRAIRRLRELELPLREIGALLEAPAEELRERLLTQQQRLAFRTSELHYALAQLQHLIEGKENLMSDTTVDPIDAATHRRLATDLFNRSWRYLELEGRTPEQDDELVHCVHASCWHWRQIGTPAHVARGEGQCSRVYASLGRAEPALHHAQRCLDLTRAGGEGFEDWDLASALEVTARAKLAAGATGEGAEYLDLARQELETVTDPDDRTVIESQLAELTM